MTRQVRVYTLAAASGVMTGGVSLRTVLRFRTGRTFNRCRAACSAECARVLDDKWEFMIAPYIWAVQINSKVTMKGYSADTTTYFSRIVNNLNAGFLGHFEAAKDGRFGFFLDLIYLKLRGDV